MKCFHYCCCLFLWCILGNDPFNSPLSLPSLYLHARLPSQDGLGSEKQNNSSNFHIKVGNVVFGKMEDKMQIFNPEGDRS